MKPFDSLRCSFALALVVPLLLSVPDTAYAAGGSAASGQSQAYLDGKQAADNENWEVALGHFQRAVEAEPENPDALNMLAYSQRHLGDLDSAVANYLKALEFDPDHRGAREYLGEAYLLLGNLEGAEEQLEALDDICWLGCEEYRELEEAIDAYRSSSS